MYSATQDILDFAFRIDSLKDQVFSKKHSIEEFAFAYKNDKIESLVLYWMFLNNMGEKAFEIEIETIDNLIGKYSSYNAERLKAMTSILNGNKAFSNIFAFDTMVECFNDHPVIANIISSFSIEEITWTCANIIGIKGADNFPFFGDVLKYITANLYEDSWELPPMFLSFPKILDMFETKEIEVYKNVTSLMSDLHLKDLVELGSNENVINSFKKTPYLINYLLNNANGAKYLINKIDKINKEIEILL